MVNPELKNQIPAFLQAGDRVAIISIAKKISLDEITFGIKTIEGWGLKVVLGKTIGAEENQFAGSDEFRLKDFQNMLDDDQIKAIIFARGGYGTVRIIDQIDFTLFSKNPKWLVGFSDLTVLQSHVFSKLGICSLHSPMPFTFHNNTMDSIEWTRKILFGEKPVYESEAHPLNRMGMANGVVVGGNLSLLYNINNTASDFKTEDLILFIEDIDEYLYHIDRMMINLKRSGKLAQLKGLIVGGFTEIKDNQISFGKTAEDIIHEHVEEFEFPVCFHFPAGHISQNLPLIIGGNAELIVTENKCRLKFQ